MRDDLEAAAHRVAGVAGAVDLRNHFRLDVRVGAVKRTVGSHPSHLCVSQRKAVAHRDGSNRYDVADDVGAELAEELPGNGADRHTGRGLAGAGALQHVANIVVTILHDAGKIRVPGPGAGHRGSIGTRGISRLLRLRVHRPLPVLPILVRNEERNRRTR